MNSVRLRAWIVERIGNRKMGCNAPRRYRCEGDNAGVRLPLPLCVAYEHRFFRRDGIVFSGDAARSIPTKLFSRIGR